MLRKKLRRILGAAIYNYLVQHIEQPKPSKWSKAAYDIVARVRFVLGELDEICGNRRQVSDLKQ